MAGKLDVMQEGTATVRSRRRYLALARSWILRLASDSLLRNSFFIMGTTVASSGLGYIYWAAAARVFPTAAVGLASALISAVNLVTILSIFGLQSAVIDLLPGQRTSRSWSVMVDAALAVVAISGVIFGTGLWLLLPVLGPNLQLPDGGAMAAFLLIGLVAVWNVTTVLDGIFIADRVAHYMFARNVVFSAVKIPLLLLPLLLPMFNRSASTILLSWILATAISLILSLFWFLPSLGYRLVKDVRERGRKARMLGTRMVGNQLIRLGGALPMYLLPVIIATRLSTSDSAYLYTTWMVGIIFFMISSSISSALFAEGSAGRGDHTSRVRKSVYLIGACLVPIGGAFLLWGKLVLEVFGPSYAAHGAVLLSILVLAAVPDAITNLAVSVWRVSGRTYAAALLNLGMSAVTLTLAWFLAPGLGVAGAGWAWLLGQSCGSVIVLASLVIRGRRGRRWKSARLVSAGD
jgi:O-antigen/teichoic acid export membrane protein